VLHLHGELMKVSLHGRPVSQFTRWTRRTPTFGWATTCEKGFQLRPHIVWFGEAVPLIPHAAEAICREADIFVIIGTSMNVYPAAGLLGDVPSHAPVYLIDPKDVSNITVTNVHHIRMGASKGVEELRTALDAKADF
jgi:NAD-dependent deacetylase